jgi:hypothetical protein
VRRAEDALNCVLSWEHPDSKTPKVPRASRLESIIEKNTIES